MTSQGMHFYDLGSNKPTHDYGLPKDLKLPLDLKKALDKNKRARDNFENFSPSVKKMTYRWLLRAKLPKTKNKRFKTIIDLAVQNKKNTFLDVFTFN